MRRRRKRDGEADWSAVQNATCPHPAEINQKERALKLTSFYGGFVFVTFKASSPVACSEENAQHSEEKRGNGLSLNRPTMGCLETRLFTRDKAKGIAMVFDFWLGGQH